MAKVFNFSNLGKCDDGETQEVYVIQIAEDSPNSTGNALIYNLPLVALDGVSQLSMDHFILLI